MADRPPLPPFIDFPGHPAKQTQEEANAIWAAKAMRGKFYPRASDKSTHSSIRKRIPS